MIAIGIFYNQKKTIPYHLNGDFLSLQERNEIYFRLAIVDHFKIEHGEDLSEVFVFDELGRIRHHWKDDCWVIKNWSLT